MAKTFTVADFYREFPNDDACLDHLMRTRFGDAIDCPKCGKRGKFHRLRKEPAYTCQWCGHHLHPMVGTPFEKTHTPLQKWLYAIYLFTTSRHGVPAKELQRQLGVTYKTAWRIGHEIRRYMAAVDGNDPLSGTVEIDDVMIGGHRPGKPGRGAAGKTPMIGMIERGGNVMTHVVPNARKRTVQPIIEAGVEKGAIVYSDELKSYDGLAAKGYTHEAVNHGRGEYVRGACHTNTIEGYWSRLKNSIRGTHVHVSGKHLQKYAWEFEFRYNMRHLPHLVFPRLMRSL
jgi:transposase-like protein